MRVGMNRASFIEQVLQGSVPHACGDEPELTLSGIPGI